MWMVQGEFPDYSTFRNKGSFHLNADQALNPYTWEPPIHWTGYVNNTEVQFTQTGRHAFSIHDFDFEDFPKELEYVQSYIIQAIDEAMRTMD